MLLAHRTVSSSLRSAAAARSGIAARSRAALSVMAFRSDKGAKLLGAAKAYVGAWQPDHAELSTTPSLTGGTRLEALLREVVNKDGMTFMADGVVHMHDRFKSIPELAHHIQERYSAYKHVIHEPFAMAVNEDNNEVFLGVRYIVQNTGPVAGVDHPTGRTSKGVLLERLGFDTHGKICSALVCRQLTREEADTLTIDPSAVRPPDIDDTMLFGEEHALPPVERSPQDTIRMEEALHAWVHCWDSGADLKVIDKILDPGVVQLSGYGLGHRSIPFMGRDAAREAVQNALDRVENANTVVSFALCDDKAAGFVHWRANALDVEKRQLQAVEGLDYLRFNPQGQISHILSFTMRPYTNVRSDEAPRQAGVD